MATIKMQRDETQFPAPHVADVHESEVENYRAGGWVLAEHYDPAVHVLADAPEPVAVAKPAPKPRAKKGAQ